MVTLLKLYCMCQPLFTHRRSIIALHSNHIVNLTNGCLQLCTRLNERSGDKLLDFPRGDFDFARKVLSEVVLLDALHQLFLARRGFARRQEYGQRTVCRPSLMTQRNEAIYPKYIWVV